MFSSLSKAVAVLIAFSFFTLSAQTSAKLKWWEEARFGMFIHWGVYSALEGEYIGKDLSGNQVTYIPTYGAEWIMRKAAIPQAEYRKYATKFTASQYDPKAWVKLAKEAGMKYIVITAKHHEGFCLFDTKASDWNAINSSAGRDLLKPLVEEAKKEGLKIGFYFSQNLDWMHGGFGYIPEIDGYASDAHLKWYVNDVTLPMIKELLTNYGKIDIFWWDIAWENKNKEYAQKMYDEAIKWGGADLITNDRLASGFEGDYSTPEGYVPDDSVLPPFEVCMSLTNTWGYSKHITWWQSPIKVIYNLSYIASKGGNFLLNIGPKADGSFTEQATSILSEVSRWMKINGEAVYGTQKRPTTYNMPFGLCTQKKEGKTKLYLHIYTWEGEELFVPGIVNNPDCFTARIIGGTEKNISIQTHQNGLLLSGLPADSPDEICTVIELTCTEDILFNEGLYVGEDLNRNESMVIPTLYARTEKVSNYDLSTATPRSFWQEVRDQSRILLPLIIRKSGRYEIYINSGGDAGKVQVSIGNKIIGNIDFSETGRYSFTKRKIASIDLQASDKPVILDLLFLFEEVEERNNFTSVEFKYLWDITTDFNHIDKSTVLYPNPAQDYLCLSGSEEATVSIYTLAGLLLFREAGNCFDISTLPTGAYVAKIELPQTTQYRHFIKK